MARYLSDQWFAAVADALTPRGSGGDPGTGADALVVEQHVHDAPEGIVMWHVEVTGDTRTIRRGPHPAPTVTFTQDYATAASVARGDISAQEAFMTGRITLSGKAGALIAAGPALAALGDALAPVRASTTY